MKKLILVLTTIIAFNCYAVTGAMINPGASFAVGFSPNGDSLKLILQSINSAKKSIHVAAYSFTSKPIAIALLNASRRGIDVKVVADLKSNVGQYSAIRFLANNHIPVKLNGNYAIFHHKFMIIDGDTLETGSFNYSANAVKHNAENVIILYHAPQIANIYEKEWQRLWSEANILNAKY